MKKVNIEVLIVNKKLRDKKMVEHSLQENSKLRWKFNVYHLRDVREC